MNQSLNLTTLMEKLSVQWIDTPEISVPLLPKEKTPFFQEIEKQKEIKQLANHYQEAILNRIKPKTEVRFLGEDIGYGLFAAETIEIGAYIGEYTGVVQPLSRSWFLFKRKHYPTDYAWDFPGLSLKGKPLEIDSCKKGNETRFINHSFEPNITDNFTIITPDNLPDSKQPERRAIFFTAIKPIYEGEQILTNYGEEYWVGGRRELILL